MSVIRSSASILLIAGLLVAGLGNYIFSSGSVSTVEKPGPGVFSEDKEAQSPEGVGRATKLADAFFPEWYEEMVNWAEDRPQEYAEDGIPIAFDASFYFKMKFLELLALNDLELVELEGTVNEFDEDTRKYDGYTKTNTGTHCDIYVETGTSSFDSLLNEFDNTIYPSNTEAFGTVGFKIGIYVYYRDGSAPESDGQGGVGGFFTGTRDHRVYIDSADVSSWGFEILAHEYQHLIHHHKDPHENLWINEGCADYAIIKAYGQNAGGIWSHLQYFEAYPDNDLTRFDGYPYDYGSTGAFITYLADHYGGDTFTKALLTNSGRGFNGVTRTLSSLGYSDDGVAAYLNWLVANYFDDTSIYDGQYGYSNLNIKVDLAGTYSSYPMSDSSDVNSWGADYFKFKSGREGMGIEFQGKGGGNDFGVWVVKKGSADTVVEYMDLDGNDYGKHPLPGFGSTYSTVVMIVTADEGDNYDFGLINMDTTPPATSLSVIPTVPDGRDTYYVTKPVVTLSTEEGATTYFYWNGNEEEASTYSDPIPILEGINTLHFYSVDIFANIEEARDFEFKVDTVSPETDYIITPDTPDGPLYNDWYITHPTIRFEMDEEGDIYYRWNDEKERKYKGSVDIREGENLMHYWGKDVAGNIEEMNSFTLKVDTTIPTTSPNLWTGAGLVENENWQNETVTVELVSDESSEIYYAWDDASYSYYKGEFESPEGEHVLSYYSIDEAGNQEYLKEITVRTDTIPPRTDISVNPEAPNGNDGVYITLPEIRLDSDDEEATIYYYWDDHYPEVFDPDMDLIEGKEGEHVLSYYSVDIAKNIERLNNLNIAVDITAPITKLSREPLSPDGEDDWYHNITFELTCSSPDLHRTFYYFDNDKTERTYDGPLLAEDMEEGERTLYYYSVDVVGNKESENSFIFKLDTESPSAVLRIDSREIEEGGEVKLSGYGSTDEMGIVRYKYIFGDGSYSTWITSGNATHTYSKEGTYTVGLRVQDTSGRESEMMTATITVTGDDVDEAFLTTPMLGAVGGVTAVTLLIILILFIRKRKRKGRETDADVPFEEDVPQKEAVLLYGDRAFTPIAEEEPIGQSGKNVDDAQMYAVSYGSEGDYSFNEMEYLEPGAEPEDDRFDPEIGGADSEVFYGGEYEPDDGMDLFAKPRLSKHARASPPEEGMEDLYLPSHGEDDEIDYDYMLSGKEYDEWESLGELAAITDNEGEDMISEDDDGMEMAWDEEPEKLEEESDVEDDETLDGTSRVFGHELDSWSL